MIQMSFDEVEFGGGEKAEKTPENHDALVKNWVDEWDSMMSLRKGGFTDNTAQIFLDYINSESAEMGYRAWQEEVEGYAQQDLNYEGFAAGARRVIRRFYAEKKVKAAGQPRAKRSKKPQPRNTKNKKGAEK